MLTEPTLSYQDQLKEERARWILWILDRLEEYPLLMLIVALVLLLLVWKCVIPLILTILRHLGITEICGISISPTQPNINKQRGKRISLLGPGNVDEAYRQISLTQTLEEMVHSVESSSPGSRIRCCMVCQDKKLAHHYAVLFYKRMEQAATLDKYGWIYYAKPRDKNMELCIQNCCFESLSIYEEIALPKDRFSAQMKYFDKPNIHTLLVIEIIDSVPETDYELRQIAEQKGLSLVLFASEPIEGYDSIDISKEGGKQV